MKLRIERSPVPGSPRSESQGAWSMSMFFWTFLAFSVGFNATKSISYNAEYLATLQKNFSPLSTSPTSVVSSATNSTTTGDATEPAIQKPSINDEEIDTRAIDQTDKPSPTTEEHANKTTSKTSKQTSTVKEIENPPLSNHTNATIPGDEEPIEFKRYEKVVIATKIHGPHQWTLVEQSLCLLHFAYNHKVLYDIVVFSAEPIPNEKIEEFRKVVAPAKFDVVMDNIGLQEEIAALTPEKRELFLERCQVKSPGNLTWFSNCRDPKRRKGSRLAYNWQAEFRSVRVWEHPALDKYKYMLWIDSDGFSSRPWKKDPVEYFIKNKGVIMFDNFPQGSTKQFTKEIVDSFNATVCDLELDKQKGQLKRNLITHEEYGILVNGNKNKTVNCSDADISMIHGFMHITDLDFYRQPKVINGLKGLLGNCFLCRRPDDQLAVTIPAAIYAPEKSWDMRMHGFNLGVVHNFFVDGHEKNKPPGFSRWWYEGGKKQLPRADKVCKVIHRE